MEAITSVGGEETDIPSHVPCPLYLLVPQKQEAPGGGGGVVGCIWAGGSTAIDTALGVGNDSPCSSNFTSSILTEFFIPPQL